VAVAGGERDPADGMEQHQPTAGPCDAGQLVESRDRLLAVPVRR
jgi:hypothetical protein